MQIQNGAWYQFYFTMHRFSYYFIANNKNICRFATQIQRWKRIKTQTFCLFPTIYL